MLKHRVIKTLLVAVVMVGAAVASQLTQQPAQSGTAQSIPAGSYRVTFFVDGDTIAVDMGGHEERIRFIGVDTPETHKPNTPVQCFGPEASDYTKQLIGTKPVRLVADPEGDNRDRYDRLLRYVYLPDNTLVDQKLISDGYGFAYVSFPFSKRAEFAAAQVEAQNAKRGLWARCQPQLKKDRWQSNDQ